MDITKTNLYEVVGVQPTASAKEIKKAYRAKALHLHPDHNEGKDSQEFKDLASAYTILSDPISKTAYDNKDFEHFKRKDGLPESQKVFMLEFMNVFRMLGDSVDSTTMVVRAMADAWKKQMRDTENNIKKLKDRIKKFNKLLKTAYFKKDNKKEQANINIVSLMLEQEKEGMAHQIEKDKKSLVLLKELIEMTDNYNDPNYLTIPKSLGNPLYNMMV